MRGKGRDRLPWPEQRDRSGLECFRGARWGVALHCSTFWREQARVPSKARKEGAGERRVGGEGGGGERDSSLALNKASSHFFFFHTSPSPSPLLPRPSLLLPPLLSLGAVFGYSMQNGLCLRAVAWNKTKRGLGRRRMLALSQLPSTLSRDVVGRELKESVSLQISSAKWSALATSTKFNPFFSSPLLSSFYLTSSDTPPGSYCGNKNSLKIVGSILFSCQYFFLNWCERVYVQIIENERFMSIECWSPFRCKVLDVKCLIPYLQ